MSIEAMKWAMEQTIVKSPTDRHVLLCIANNARDDGTAAFPAISTVSRKTGLAERTVKYAIQRLLACGVMRRGNPDVVAAHIKRADARPNGYDLALESGLTQDVSGVHLTTERGAARAPRYERGASDDSNGVHLTTERGAARAPDPSLIPTKENHPERDAPATPSPPKKTAERGTRLPDDWMPTFAQLAWANTHWPNVDAAREADVFRDYWIAVAGAKGVKRNWDATWRNWIRRAAPTNQPNRGSSHAASQSGSRESVAERAERFAREGDERDRRRAAECGAYAQTVG